MTCGLFLARAGAATAGVGRSKKNSVPHKGVLRSRMMSWAVVPVWTIIWVSFEHMTAAFGTWRYSVVLHWRCGRLVCALLVRTWVNSAPSVFFTLLQATTYLHYSKWHRKIAASTPPLIHYECQVRVPFRFYLDSIDHMFFGTRVERKKRLRNICSSCFSNTADAAKANTINLGS